MSRMTENRRDRLAARQERSFNRKKSTGGFRVLDTSEYPDMEWLKPELGTEFFLDIIPFEITDKKHPDYKLLKEEMLTYKEEWMEDFKLNLDVHRGVGPEKKQVVCPKRNYGKPCPICEEHDRLMEEHGFAGTKDGWKKGGKVEAIKNLRPSNRSFFIVRDLNNEGVMKFFEYSNFWFTKNLEAQVKDERNAVRNPKDILLGDLSDDGYSIAFKFTPSTFDDEKPGEVKVFKFESRDKGDGYPDDDLFKAPKLDTMVKILSYDQIENILFGNEEDEDSSSDDTTSNSELDEEPPRRIRRRASSEEEMAKDEEEIAVEDTPVEVIEAKEEPKSDRASRRAARQSEVVEEATGCPNGLEFGEDIDLPNCSGKGVCPVYAECDKEFERLESVGK